MKKYNPIYLKLAALNMVEEDGKIWMALLNRNGICEVDKAARRARILKVFNGESPAQEYLYGKMEKAGDNLVFAPWDAESIAVYNLKSDIITYIPLRERIQKLKESPTEAKFWNTMRFRSIVYLLGYSYPAIIKIDTETLSVEYITNWVEEVEGNIDEGDNCGYFGDGYVVINDLALFPIGCMKAVLELNLKTAETKLRKLAVSAKGIGGIGSADRENIWLVGRGDHTNWLSCWNIRTDEIKEIQLEENGGIGESFYAPICTESKVLLMPCSASGIYVMSLDIGKSIGYKKLEVQTEEGEKAPWIFWRKTLAPRLLEGKLCYVTSGDLKWHEYDVKTGKQVSYFIYLEEETEEYFAAVYKKQREIHSVISEIEVPLESFVDEAQMAEDWMLSQNNRYHLIGRKIYDRVCEGI